MRFHVRPHSLHRPSNRSHINRTRWALLAAGSRAARRCPDARSDLRRPGCAGRIREDAGRPGQRARRDPAPGGDGYEGFREDDELRSALRTPRPRPARVRGALWNRRPALASARRREDQRSPALLCAAPLALPRAETPRSLLGGLIAYGLRRHGFRSGRGGRAQLPLPLFFLLLFLEEISLALGKRIIGLRQLAILRLGGLETKHRVSHFRPPRCKRCR